MTIDPADEEYESLLAQRRQEIGPLPASREVFDAWRAPREGAENPTRMDNPVWPWLVRNRIGAYAVVDIYGAESGFACGPTWCFERFGQSETRLPDGRTLYVGGEHEDHYDPDFHIYNDVVVVGPNGEIEIYVYPKAAFPPTDFHSASLVDGEVYIIGRLGYPEDRRPRIESVHVLETTDYRFRTLTTSGTAPPWLHGHAAEVDSDGSRIRISGGHISSDDSPVLVENLDRWELRLTDGVWTRIEYREWPRWYATRAQSGGNALWTIRQMLWSRSVGWSDSEREERTRLASLLGPDADPDRIEALYSPPIPHQSSSGQEGPSENEYGVWRIIVDGVIVRYNEEMHGVMMTVEGVLSETVCAVLVEDLRVKLSAIEGHAYRTERIRMD
jgi:hypothetical protein